MVKLWTVCTKVNLHNLLQYGIVFSIVLCFVTQPVIKNVLDLTDYELCTNYEDEDVEEKEEFKEEQKKEPEFYPSKERASISSTNTSAYSIAETILYSQLNYIREFYLEIPIPPPESI